jgi:hypothetical protein
LHDENQKNQCQYQCGSGVLANDKSSLGGPDTSINSTMPFAIAVEISVSSTGNAISGGTNKREIP